jgi:predicted nuclease with TOPRIM domain
MVKFKCVDECSASSLNEKLIQALSERDELKKKLESVQSELDVTRKEVGVWRNEAKREEANAKRWYREWSHVLDLYNNLTKESTVNG